jgi:dihydrofolate reductase
VRRLITWSVLTLDGFVPSSIGHDVDRHRRVWEGELQRFALEQPSSADTLLFGRHAYEVMAAAWSSAHGETAAFLNATPKIVFSRGLKHAGWRNTRLVASDPASEVASLKRKRGKDLLLLGSAALSSLLVRRGLVDEWRPCVTPLILGRDRSPLASSSQRSRVKLLETRLLSSGGVMLRYERTAKPAGQSASLVDGPYAETKEWLLASGGAQLR